MHGGKVVSGETSLQDSIRELKEEIGTCINPNYTKWLKKKVFIDTVMNTLNAYPSILICYYNFDSQSSLIEQYQMGLSH